MCAKYLILIVYLRRIQDSSSAPTASTSSSSVPTQNKSSCVANITQEEIRAIDLSTVVDESNSDQPNQPENVIMETPNNGVDPPEIGDQESPCISITVDVDGMFLTDPAGNLLPDFTIKNGTVSAIVNVEISNADLLRTQNILAFKLKRMAAQNDRIEAQNGRIESMLTTLLSGDRINPLASSNSSTSTIKDEEKVAIARKVNSIEEMTELEKNLQSVDFSTRFVSIISNLH